ncbi:MAG: hypothetical protein AAFQ15_17370 [Pseudomonadota bacterium]
MKVTRRFSALERIGFFVAGCGFGWFALGAAVGIGTNEYAEAATIFCGLCSLGGFIGAFKGKQSI